MTVIINGTTGVTFPNGVTMSDGTSAPVTVAQGGTNATTASGARTSLGAAASGANSDITSLGGLTTALSVAQGGTNNASLGVTAGGVVYSDGSKLANTGAGTSGYYLQSNGASAPTWTAVSTTPTTAQVLSATAGASVGAIGTYALLIKPSGGWIDPGNTVAGSSCWYTTASGEYNGVVGISGTWRCMGYAGWNPCVPSRAVTVYLRIS